MNIDFANHYWRIASAPNLYSSKSNTLVAEVDPAWSGDVSDIASEAELAEMLKPRSVLPDWMFNSPDTFIQPAVGTYTKGQLEAYEVKVRDIKLTTTITVNGQPFATDPITVMSLNSAYIYVQSKTAETFQWKLPDGSFITLNKTQITSLQSCVAAYGQSCFDCEMAVLAGVDAGTTTTLEAIDAAYAAVPTVFTGSVVGTELAQAFKDVRKRGRRK